MNTFGERLDAIMKTKNITNIELAQTLQITPQGVRRIRNGMVGQTYRKLPLIAKALGCRIDDLFPEMDEVQEDGKPVRADGFEEEKTAGQAAKDGETDDDEWGGFDFT